MKIDGIIFDLDGTLWDSTIGVVDSWNKTMEHYKEAGKVLTVDDVKGVMGLAISDIGKVFFPHLEETKRTEIMDECCKTECEHLRMHGAILFDKLEETLEELSKDYKMFIVSNCQDGYIESFYEAHKLEKYFIDFENPGRTGLTKGENIKLVIERNNLKNPVYVGDTEGDRKAARFAGIPFIYARYGFGEVKEYDYAVDSFDVILKLIREIGE